MPRVLFTVPPFWIVNVPEQETPTLRPVDSAPAAPITVALGVTVSILVLVELVGTAANQLAASNQSVEAAPDQNSTARDGVAVAQIAPSVTTNVVLRLRRNHQAKQSAMRPRYGSFPAAPRQYDSHYQFANQRAR
ncbi:MAG: hypothetical protein ABJA75_17995 [Bradyrhizobium sp.]